MQGQKGARGGGAGEVARVSGLGCGVTGAGTDGVVAGWSRLMEGREETEGGSRVGQRALGAGGGVCDSVLGVLVGGAGRWGERAVV